MEPCYLPRCDRQIYRAASWRGSRPGIPSGSPRGRSAGRLEGRGPRPADPAGRDGGRELVKGAVRRAG